MRLLSFVLCASLCSSLFLACAGEPDPHDASGEDDLLPNQAIFEREHDGSGYKTIAQAFAQRGYDMHVVLAGFAPSWPIAEADQKTAVLTRVGTPIRLPPSGYYHSGLDVMRS